MGAQSVLAGFIIDGARGVAARVQARMLAAFAVAPEPETGSERLSSLGSTPASNRHEHFQPEPFDHADQEGRQARHVAILPLVH